MQVLNLIIKKICLKEPVLNPDTNSPFQCFKPLSLDSIKEAVYVCVYVYKNIYILYITYYVLYNASYIYK